ncbi:MAG TPA: carbohydrate ABC transporter permease [Clostridiaceae bacterium]|nr:carbohydrate ABC transporter permease [Clostridiaceae bacterium]
MSVQAVYGTVKKTIIDKNFKVKRTVLRMIVTIVMFCLGIAIIIPFLWMISASFKRPLDVLKYPVEWIPKYWYPQNYIDIMSKQSYNFGLMYLNSIKITAINVTGSVLTSCLAGYAFARLKFKGRDHLFLLYLATMIIPPQVTMVPRFMLFDFLGIINTHWSLILPGIFTPFGVFMMRQFFMQIPFELSESARIDGAGEIKTWAQIIMPLAKTAIVTLVILTFCWHWNDYENPLIFLRDRKLLTIPVGLDLFKDEAFTDANLNLILAAATLSIMPIFIIFTAGQKYFIEGMAAGAVKG